MSTAMPPSRPPYFAPPQPVRWVPPSSATGQYNVQSLEALKQQLGGGVLNASRIEVDPNYLYGLQDGEPAIALKRRLLPNTDNPKLDRALAKTEEVAGYIPPAIGNTAVATLKGSIVGGIGAGALLGIGSALLKIVAKEGFSWGNVMAIMACFSLLGSLGGALAGFGQSMYENLKDLKDVVLGPKIKP